MAVGHWEDFDGWATSRNVNVRDLDLDQMCNLIWYWATRNGETKDVEQFRLRLWRPDPKDIDKPVTVGPWSAEAEQAAFAKAKAAFAK